MPRSNTGKKPPTKYLIESYVIAVGDTSVVAEIDGTDKLLEVCRVDSLLEFLCVDLHNQLDNIINQC